MLVWPSWFLGKLEVYAILDKVATDHTEFILFLILSPTYVKSYHSIFVNAWIWFWKMQSTLIRFRNVRSTFISHNFHVRKEYDLHHLKPDLASLDGMTTTINICFFLKYFLFTK
jgi:hypothetical protein